MKKISFLAIIAATLLLTACSKATKIETIADSITVPVKGQSDTIVVCADAAWNVEAPDWAKIDKREKCFIVNVPANTTGNLLKGEIIISGASGVSKAITISQNYKASYLDVSESTVEFTNQGGNKDVEVLTDGGDVKIAGAQKIKAVYTDGKLSLTASVNESTEFIAETITITVDDFKTTVDVVVAGKVCKTCNGTGLIKCPKCNGTGFTNKTCKECGGMGMGYCCDYTGKEPCYKDHANYTNEVVCPDCKGQK